MSLKFYISLLLLTAPIYSEQPFTIMIDPTGDAKHTGREIYDTFERGITIQCAQELKEQLTKLSSNIRVVLTRVPGETLQPLQNASFANRLGVDFYVTLSFYPESELPSHIAIFYYLQNLTDTWHKYMPLKFYHVTQAYLINIQLTQEIGKKFIQILKNKEQNTIFSVLGLFGVPINPLVGITAPALYIEVGLKNKDDWKYLIKPLTTCLQTIIP